MWSCHYLSSSLSSSLLSRPVLSVTFSPFLCLSFGLVFSLFLSLTVSVSVCLLWWWWLLRCAVVCVCCGVCVCAVRCVVCDTLKNHVCRFNVLVCTFNTSPCVPAPRAHMVYTCARSASIHGDVLNVHTGTCWAHGGKERKVRGSLSASCFHW